MDRTLSMNEFQSQSSQAAAITMRKELDKLISMVKNGDEKKTFTKEMEDFYALFIRFLQERAIKQSIDWSKCNSPADDQVVPHASLPSVSDDETNDILSKLCVLKLNGGLGTSMGCVGPKSAIEVRNDMTFLDLTVRQIEHLNSTYGTSVPLLLMNSFNTDDETCRIIQKYSSHDVNILTFNQSRFPRFGKDSMLPIPRTPDSDKEDWFPPGHGDLYQAFHRSGMIDSLLAQGKEYVFVSNIDNLGATVDLAILKHMITTKAEFLMEVTNKTRADVKGGTLIDYDGVIRLLEIAQVPPEHVDDFKSINKFKIFNTNNIWIDLRAIKRVVENKELQMELIVNPKTMSSGEKVLQLETAVGAAIRYFEGAHGINVPRSRFLPVKSTSDLFLVQSDLYSVKSGALLMNPKRMFGTTPLVKLGDHFKKVKEFLERFKSPPHILELDHLTVTGDVAFGNDVVLKGTVIIVANHGYRIDIPSGAILENKVVSGNLRILDH